jgi:GntR family transcriptional repressor for pyruvate dehydrogenase complex
MDDRIRGLSLDARNTGVAGHRFFSNLLKDKALSDLVSLLLGMGPGDQIPSERELAETLNVSRTAIRDRISKLESLGLLQRKERSGTYFTGIRPESVSDVLILSMLSSQMTVDSLVSVRHALERQAAIEACRARNTEALASLGAAVKRMYETDDGFELFEADNEFHRSLFAASESEGLIFFSRMLHAVLSGTLQHVTLERDRGTLRKLHAAIYDAVLAADEDAANEAMDRHFDWLGELVASERAS